MTMDVLLLLEADLRRCVALDTAAIDCIERGFSALATEAVVMPPILSMPIEPYRGEVDVKTAFVPGVESFAIKMSPGFFDNPSRGLPSTSGLMVLLSAETGMLEALLLDNGYLTDVRTAAAGAVAARHLAPVEAESACVIGAGTQAALQLAALCRVRPIQQATVWARDPAKAAGFAERQSAALGIVVTPSTDRASAVNEADVILTTTPAHEPLIAAEWLRAGQHVTSMGSDQPHKRELDTACFARADRYVPDRQSQTAVLGELHHALEAGVVAPDARFDELGDIVARRAPGRGSEHEITICDLTGTGVQDTAIATFARARAEAMGIGTAFRNEMAVA